MSLTTLSAAGTGAAAPGAVKTIAGQPTWVTEIGPKKIAAVSGITGGTAVLIYAKPVFAGTKGCYRYGFAVMCLCTALLRGNAVIVLAWRVENSVAGAGKGVAQPFTRIADGRTIFQICGILAGTTRHEINSNTKKWMNIIVGCSKIRDTAEVDPLVSRLHPIEDTDVSSHSILCTSHYGVPQHDNPPCLRQNCPTGWPYN